MKKKEAEEKAKRFAEAAEKLCKDLKFSKEETKETVENAKKYWLKHFKDKK